MNQDICDELEFRVTHGDGFQNLIHLLHIYYHLRMVLADDVPIEHSQVVELGCNQGQTSVLIAKMLKSYPPSVFSVYDTFAGMPHPTHHDTAINKADRLMEGRCAATKSQFIQTFKDRGCLDRLPVIHQGDFRDTLHDCLPERISFALLDSDWYDSIKVSLEHVVPRMVDQGVIIIDDYGYRETPGVKQAVDDFLHYAIPSGKTHPYCTPLYGGNQVALYF